MAQKKRPEPSPYSSFDAIGSNRVHLRGVGDDESVEPRYRDAELTSGLTGKEGERSGTFYVHSTGLTVPGISEINYVAWNRY